MPAAVTIGDPGTGGIDIVVGKGDRRPALVATLSWVADGVLPADLSAIAGASLVTATAKADAQPKLPTAQPDFSRAVQLVTTGWTTNGTVDVTITGTDIADAALTETVTIGTVGTTVQGTKVFKTITSITWTQPAGWSAGTFAVQAGATATVEYVYRVSTGNADTRRACLVTSVSARTVRYEWIAADTATANTFKSRFVVTFAVGITMRAPAQSDLTQSVVGI